MVEKIKAMLQSRRFWLAVAGVVVAAAAGLGLDLDPQMVQNVVLLLASWILGDSIRQTNVK